jgi:hypothetical protein
MLVLLLNPLQSVRDRLSLQRWAYDHDIRLNTPSRMPRFDIAMREEIMAILV